MSLSVKPNVWSDDILGAFYSLITISITTWTLSVSSQCCHQPKSSPVLTPTWSAAARPGHFIVLKQRVSIFDRAVILIMMIRDSSVDLCCFMQYAVAQNFRTDPDIDRDSVLPSRSEEQVPVTCSVWRPIRIFENTHPSSERLSHALFRGSLRIKPQSMYALKRGIYKEWWNLIKTSPFVRSNELHSFGWYLSLP